MDINNPRQLAGIFNLDLEVEAAALDGVGSYLTVGDGHVFRVLGIAFEGFF